MYTKIENIINEWDPVDLFPLAPKDEYKSEVNNIIKLLEKDQYISINELTEGINQIFNNSFWKNLIFKSNTEEIAKKILSSIKN